MSLNPAQHCAGCNQALDQGLWIEAEGQPLCERCFLRGHRAPMELVPISEAAGILTEALAEALDLREHETGLHSKRVACHTLVLARRVLQDSERLHQVYWGALLHDIGKIGIPDAILLKHGALTEPEWVQMKTHPETGYRIVSRVPGLGPVHTKYACATAAIGSQGKARGAPFGYSKPATSNAAMRANSRRPEGLLPKGAPDGVARLAQ